MGLPSASATALAPTLQIGGLLGLPLEQWLWLLLAAGVAVVVARVVLSVARLFLSVAWRVVTVATVLVGALYAVSKLAPAVALA
ncbi:hypothetical protein [Halegenticoccus soli]|uniref:hypothetical protein n=1 Tax=Halegenticoccus soli TaxID=1985678 RepID=UPI000C6DAC58|nr:hypothetical protein [Halegenticoccus soli]